MLSNEELNRILEPIVEHELIFESIELLVNMMKISMVTLGCRDDLPVFAGWLSLCAER